MEEAVEKVLGYSARASQLFENGEGLAKKGELEKAGEFFWGAIACYINALRFMHTGKAHGGHKEMVLDAKKIAAQIGDTPLFEAIEGAEKFHANYYHSFIPKDEFPQYYKKAEYAFLAFHRLLEQEKTRLGIPAQP